MANCEEEVSDAVDIRIFPLFIPFAKTPRGHAPRLAAILNEQKPTGIAEAD